MSTHVNPKYNFEDFAVDVDQRVLLRADKPVPLTPKMFDTLLILIEKHGRIVEKDELMTRLWPDTFVEEANLAFNIQQLRKALGDSARQPRYIETVARRGYRFIAPVKEAMNDGSQVDGQPDQQFESSGSATSNGNASESQSSLASANGTTETIAGEFTTRETAAGGPVTRPLPRVSKAMLAVAAVVGLLIVGGWLLWSRLSQRPQSSPAGRTMIAVLPFENLTGDANQDYFSDGLTEEMIAQLGSFNPHQLGVIARTSVMHYKEKRQPLAQIGRELGVEYVIEGSVRRDADNVRITVQLIRVDDQTHVWARQYDHQLRDVLALQHKVGQEVANQIQIALGQPVTSEIARPAQSPQSYEAYELWLKGQYFFNKRKPEDFDKAIQYFQRALEKEPNYARAYTGLASCYALMGGYATRPQIEFMQQARAAAERALQLEEGLSEAHTVMALIVQKYDFDWLKAEKEFRRAIELNGNSATAHHWFAEHLMWQGRFEEALRESNEARRLDPLSLIIAADYGAILYYGRQYDRAIKQFLAVRELDPTFQRAALIIHAYDEKGLFDLALAEIEAHRPPGMMNPAWYWAELAYAYGRSGQQAEAQRALETLMELNRRQAVGAEVIVWAYLGVGDKNQALTWLERAHAQRSPAITNLKVDPRYDALRGDPRFQNLLRRAGLDQ